MRAFAATVTLLLLLAPLGLAEDGEDGSSSSSMSSSSSPAPHPAAGCERFPPGSSDREHCLREAREADCDDPAHETDAKCRPADNATGNKTAPPPGDHDGCRDDDDDAEERCEAAVRQIAAERGRDWISFTVDAANATLLGYTIDGLLALDAVHLGLDDGNLSIERQGSLLTVRDGDAELRLHDEPNGLIRFKGDAGNVTLDFPSDAAVGRIEHGARVAYDGGRQGHLLAENATWIDNHTVQLSGFFAFHVPPSAVHEDAHDEVEERKQDAIERRTVGAEITLKPRGPQAVVAAQNDSVEILAYDDVEVEVDEAGLSGDHAPLRLVVSSELDEGRTIVVNVDQALLASTDPKDLVLRYFDLHNQTDGSTIETEVLFHQASSLSDVLDPADDGGQPEFWVVEDANGVQVLVSVPHWSAHAITVASIATVLSTPNVTVGIVAGAAASLVMGALLVWPRRRDDEL